MFRVLNRILDDAIFELVKLTYRGFAERMPGFRAPDPCDVAVLSTIGVPERFHRVPEGLWQGYRTEVFAFDSPGECVCEESSLVTGRLLTAGPRAPWVLIVPGYSTGALPPDEYGWFQDGQGLALLRRGVNVALIDLPFHMKRRRTGRGSGEGFFSPDLREVQRAFLQAAADCVALVRHLQMWSGRPAGVWGTSLGGNVAGLVGASVNDLSALVLMEPLDNPGNSMATLHSTREIRAKLQEAGVDPKKLPALLQDIAPSRYPPKVPRERMLFFTPLWDRIIAPHLQEAFWRAWGCPERVVAAAGHLTMPARTAINNRAADFLANWTLGRRT